ALGAVRNSWFKSLISLWLFVPVFRQFGFVFSSSLITQPVKHVKVCGLPHSVLLLVSWAQIASSLSVAETGLSAGTSH
ncbi:hypothetical protein P3565_23200, partial [Vibrio parahaemolyticus]|nr:hypothetical protein [Vibrio parahaemolyticus]